MSTQTEPEPEPEPEQLHGPLVLRMYAHTVRQRTRKTLYRALQYCVPFF